MFNNGIFSFKTTQAAQDRYRVAVPIDFSQDVPLDISFQYHDLFFISLIATGRDPLTDTIRYIIIMGKSFGYVIKPDLLTEEELRTVNFILLSNADKTFKDAKLCLKFLKYNGFSVNGSIFDLSLASKVINSGLPGKELDFYDLAEKYLGVKLDKSVWQMELKQPHIDLLAKETDAVFKLADLFKAELGKDGLTQTADLEFEAIHAFTQLELSGIAFDKDKWNSAIQSTNPTSKVADHIHPVTKRLHPQYNQNGAATGRASCTNPNLQSIRREKEFRECFIASPGHKLILADYSQIELRVSAEISGDRAMIEAFQQGKDLHRYTASCVTGVAYEQVTAGQRQQAKAINFGLIYAMGTYGLMKYAKESYGVQLTEQQAYTFRHRFFKAFKGIAAWHERVSYASETRTLVGRRRLWNEEPTINEILNAPVQGTAADIMKKALTILHWKIKNSNAHIVGMIHDEVLLEVPEAAVDWAKSVLVISMKQAGECFLKSVPVEVDVVVADNWAGKQ